MHVRGWIKDVMYGLIIFGICAALILVVSVAADNIVAKHNAVIVSKNVNSNLDCDDSICTSVDNVSGSENDENVNLACDGREQYNNNNNIKDKKIACWGDSITYGLGGQENTYIKSEAGIIDASNWNYPDTLRYYTGMDVYNLGVCGETSYEIALRQGGIKMYVGKQVIVKPGKRTQISIVDESGNPVILENFNGYETDNQQPENVVYINDIPFKLEYDNSRIYISIYDNAVDKSVKLKKGSQIITKAAHDISGDVLVIQMGSNGGWNDYDELIEQYKAMIANSGTECYIIIGDTDNPEESVDSANYTSGQKIGTDDSMWEAALREAFGEHFINMRTYLLENALNIAGLEPTQMDEEDLSQGRVPETIKYDYTHLNSYGYYAIGYGVYEKGLELGYW